MRFHITLPPTHAERLRDLAAAQGVIRSKEVNAHGIPLAVLQRMVDRGELRRISRGLYSSPEAPITRNHTLVAVTAKVQDAVINLLSALAFHELTNESPHAVWIAVPRGRHQPTIDFVELELTRTANRFLEAGVDAHEVEGRQLRVTSPARTVADCFKYRSRVGLDIALRALRDFLRQHRQGRAELWKMAGHCRVQSVLRPYLESMST